MARVTRMTWSPLIVAAVLLGTTACSASLNDIHVGDRTLLIYPATGTTADAVMTGVLHANSAGCLAVGASVCGKHLQYFYV